MSATPWTLVCAECNDTYDGLALRYRCDCGGTLDVRHDFVRLPNPPTTRTFQERLLSRQAADRSGVWRFRELILPLDRDDIVTRPEGNTTLYCAADMAKFTGTANLLLKHEGENPTGSFKDRGMTVGVTMAKKLGFTRVACASTGNTSASMAAYAARAGMSAFVFIPNGKIAYGKLSQALAYGAHTIQIDGDFDLAMQLVEQVSGEEGIYLLNSVNPFRIEGQKAIGLEILQDLAWDVPDWIVLPGGNLGNSSALAKGLMEAKGLGLINRLPRIAIVQAQGANPLYTAFATGRALVPVKNAETIATAIRIGNPVSSTKSLRGLRATDGVVTEVTDQEILDAKAWVDRSGIGAEPASCATVAGLKRLIEEGVISPSDRVVGILTGNLLKDPDVTVGYHQKTLEPFAHPFANQPKKSPADLASVLRVIRESVPAE